MKHSTRYDREIRQHGLCPCDVVDAAGVADLTKPSMKKLKATHQQICKTGRSNLHCMVRGEGVERNEFSR